MLNQYIFCAGLCTAEEVPIRGHPRCADVVFSELKLFLKFSVMQSRFPDPDAGNVTRCKCHAMPCCDPLVHEGSLPLVFLLIKLSALQKD